jgi:tRNA G18 (ribose-2'-O)-methylase SpoU
MREVRKHPIVAVLENIRSVHNVGSILRTCDATLVDHVFVTGYTPRPSHAGIQKTALGSQHTVAWTEADDAVGVLRKLRVEGYTIAALEITDSPTSIRDVSVSFFPLALVVGNELEGVSEEALAEADFALEIPQYGSKQSMNVAVAFGVAAAGLVERYLELFRVPGSRFPSSRT